MSFFYTLSLLFIKKILKSKVIYRKIMKDLILIGRQGSGKGTQGKILAEKFGYSIFETGAVLRAIAKEDSDLGKKINKIISCGDLVSNDIIMELVVDFIEKVPENTPVLFDGIPRSMEQRESLEKELNKFEREFKVLEITLSNKEAFNRLIKRGQIEGRSDDNVVAIQNRIDHFDTHTQPIVNFWAEKDLVISVNGEQNIEKVTEEMIEKLGLKDNLNKSEKK